MNLDRAKALIGGPIPDTDFPVDDLLGQLKTIPVETTINSVFLAFPKSYLNRKDERVDICGAIDIGTKEYDRGWRFFCSDGSFYRGDGRRFETHECPDDLVGNLVSNDSVNADVITFTRRWVHVKHRVLQSFFRKLFPGKAVLKTGGWYLNRKGFVIHLVEREVSGNGNVSFIDEGGMSYDEDGNIGETFSSMHDLTHEIKNEPLFALGDWSTDEFPHIRTEEDEDDSLDPMMFDPNSGHREVLTKSLFEHTLKAYELAKDLGISYGFFMNDPANST